MAHAGWSNEKRALGSLTVDGSRSPHHRTDDEPRSRAESGSTRHNIQSPPVGRPEGQVPEPSSTNSTEHPSALARATTRARRRTTLGGSALPPGCLSSRVGYAPSGGRFASADIGALRLGGSPNHVCMTRGSTPRSIGRPLLLCRHVGPWSNPFAFTKPQAHHLRCPAGGHRLLGFDRPPVRVAPKRYSVARRRNRRSRW